MGISRAEWRCPGRPKAALVLSPQQREQLEGMANSRSLPAGLVIRVRIVLERFRKDEPKDRPPIGTGERHGGQVEAAISGAGCGRTARRVTAGPSAPY